MALPDPVIVIPGVTANYLQDRYPLPPDDFWTVLSLDYTRAMPHPDNPGIEAVQPAFVQPGQLYEIAYKEIIEELRHNLSPSADQPVPVFGFSYNWRQQLEKTEEDLSRFVDDVIARTSALRHYVRDGYPARAKVNLVAHSMGGLIAAGYLSRYEDKSRVGKVVTLAAPWHGSFEAVIKVTTGTANLGAKTPSSREREAARVTPSLYYLLPDVPDGLFTDPPLPDTLFDPGLWQPSILNSIQETIRLYGNNPNDIPGQAITRLKTMLSDASAHRSRINAFRLDSARLTPKDWLCVVGVNATTRVRLQVVKQADGTPDFQFHSSDRDNQWANHDQAQRIYTGDGTVPFEGAVPSFLERANLVCVTPEDYGYWEWSDQITTAIAGFHGLMPNMNMLHRLIVRHFTGASDDHGNTWGRRAPGVENWAPPLPLFEK
jgi:pimeloyl-ACP methyl ester carboxylesterase